MRKLFLFLILSTCAFAQQFPVTPNIQLQLPPYGTTSWDQPLNFNFSTIDAAIGSLQSIFQGNWASNVTYLKGQIVSYQGILYLSLSGNNLGNTPSVSPVFWSLFFQAVNNINGNSGPFTFSGAGVSCVGTTCVFNGGGSAPSPPSFSVQIANAASTNLLSDPNITVNTTTHTLSSQIFLNNGFLANRNDVYDVISDGGAVCNWNGTIGNDDAVAINALIAAHPGATFRFPNYPKVCRFNETVTAGSGHILGSGSNYGTTATSPTGSTISVAYGVDGFLGNLGSTFDNFNIIGSEPSSSGTTDGFNVVFPAAGCIDAQQYKLPINTFSVSSGTLTLGFGNIPTFYKNNGIVTLQGVPSPNGNLNSTYYIGNASNTYVASMTIPVTGASNVSSTSGFVTTTATGTSGTNTVAVASATGIAIGQYVNGNGALLPNTFVTNISGLTITLSKNLAANISSSSMTFNAVLRLASTGSCSRGIHVTSSIVKITNVVASNFGLAGVEIDGETPNISDAGAIVNSTLQGNRFAGLFLHGEDANEGTYIGGLYYVNNFAGIVDFSFLGSHYTQPTVSYNYGGLQNISSWPGEGTSVSGCTLTRSSGVVTVSGCSNPTNTQVGTQLVVHGMTDTSYNAPTSPASSSGYVTSLSPLTYTQPGYNLSNGSTSGGTIAIASMKESFQGFGVNGGCVVLGLNNTAMLIVADKVYCEGGEGQLNPGGFSVQGNFNIQFFNPTFGDPQDPNFTATTMSSGVAAGTIFTMNSFTLKNATYSFTFPASAPSGSSTFLSCPSGGGTCSWVTSVGGVSSVSNSDSTLTISPTTGSVVASLNLGNANTWSANQTSAKWIASTGFDITGATTAGHYLRNNGTDYVDNSIQVADVPTLNQSTTGNAATATNLSTNGTANQVWAMNSSGSAQGWATTNTPASPNTYYQLNNSGSFGTATLLNASSTDQSTATNGISAPQFTATGTLAQIVNTRIPNSGTTGTVANTLAIINSSGNAVTATTSNTGITVYPVIASWTAAGITSCAAGTTGNACLVIAGEASVTFDSGGGTAGHYVGASTVTAGDAIDLGTTVSAGVFCLGTLLTSPAGGAAGTVALGACPAPSSGITSVTGTSPITASGTPTATVACATCVVASSPGAGIAQFAGGTQTVTSSTALANGTTATTQTVGDNTTKVATDAFVLANAAGPPTVSIVAGDLACAVANDLTIASRSITGGSSTATTITITGAVGFNGGYYVGEIINVQGVTPAGFNAVNQVIASLSGSTSITYTNSSNPGAWSSGGTVSKYCSNQTNDAILATPFTFNNSFSVPANYMASGLILDVQAQMLFYEPTANAASIPAAGGLALKYGSTNVYQNVAAIALSNSANAAAPFGGMFTWTIVGLGTTTAVTEPKSAVLNSVSTPNTYVNNNGTVQPATGLVTTSTTLVPTLYYTATGVASGTYTSGGSITGSATQTCTLTAFNNSSTATATVALTGTNTIASGTALVITARGAAATAAPTSATLGNGTATCSGTATIATVLGGSPGNAIELMSFSVRKN